MKKTLTIVALILAITVSLVAGTVSYYTTTIEELAGGSVVAKAFSLTGAQTQEFKKDVKIAPGETVTWGFKIDASSETGMAIAVDVKIQAATGKTIIDPLKITVKDEANQVIDIKDFKYNQEANQNLSKTFTVTVEWPWETESIDDIKYAGAGYGSALTVSVTGTQVQP